jgi:trigger factor
MVEAVNDALPELYTKALEENELTPLSQPEVDVKDVEYGVDLAFTAEVDIRPKIELPEYHGLEAEVEDIAVSDADVEEQVQTLRQRFGTLTTVERAAEDGDFVTIDVSATQNGEEVPQAQASGMSYQIGSGTLLEGLDDAVTGLSAGEEATFETKLAGATDDDAPLMVTVKVVTVKEQELPELDDEFAQSASEFDTVDELTADLRERLTRVARMEQADEAREAVLAKLRSLVEVPLPDAVVESEVAGRKDALTNQLSYANLSPAQYYESQGQTEEEFDAQLETQVRESIATQFLLEAISEAEEWSVEESELAQAVVRRAQQVGVSPQEYMRHAVEHDHIPELVAEVRRMKSLQHLMESAHVKDKSGAHVELARLMPDGTYAEIEEVDDDDTAAEGTEQNAASAPSTDAAAGVVYAGDYLVVDEDK